MNKWIAEFELEDGDTMPEHMDLEYKGTRIDFHCRPLEPKMGHWVGHREHCENLGVMPSGLGAYEWCSNCDCGIDVREWHRNHYNFCPNCGADMREVEK